ncbi:MAG: hypothetical protein DRH90_24890 [Deltaproteobacteria bacterium]|nr:MAG: hypothetical protein DRH90_24890 [Deltaproteobacteria bacterium]
MEDWRKYANSIMLSFIVLVLSAGGAMLNNTIGTMRDSFFSIDKKLDAIIITSTINSERITANDIGANELRLRIRDLELESNDDITKTEALEAIDNLREYVEMNFDRK